MRKIKVRRVLTAASVPAMGVMLALPLGGLFAGSAAADSTCYTGCASPDGGGAITTSASTSAPTTSAATSSPDGGIAFTGADIEEMAVIGIVATGVGAVLVRSSRRRHA